MSPTPLQTMTKINNELQQLISALSQDYQLDEWRYGFVIMLKEAQSNVIAAQKLLASFR
jgi:hypothetical protein